MERLEQLQQSAVESKEQRRKINLLDDEKKAYQYGLNDSYGNSLKMPAL